MTMGEPDNLGRPPRRPLDVASDDLERALRETLSRAATPEHGVGGPDPAGRAIGKGRRINRRRSVVGTVLVVAATAAATAGVVQLNPDDRRYAGPAWIEDPPPEIVQSLPAIAPTTAVPVPSGTFDRDKMSATRAPVDLVVATQLRTATGTAITLPQVGTVAQAHEATKGWLVVGVPPAGGSSLWYVASDGSSVQVLHAVDAVALAPDGRRVAWRDSARLFSAVVDQGTLKDATQASAPEEGLPVSFVGSGVVMERTSSGAQEAGFDVWWPRRGTPYTPEWKASTSEIYGPLPDGRTVVAQVTAEAGDRPCLALLDAVNALTVLKTACALQLTPRGDGTVSPDGRWLVADGAGRSRLVDLRVVFEGEATSVDAGPELTDQSAWASGSTLVHVSRDGQLMRVKVGREPEVDVVAVPGAGTDDRLLVVDPMLV
ncbi:hypothetical protein RB614_19980 [Phytohabitans sp. ZYX-F-186]|uniref:Lipoprotein LpqB beta-propeller domain-containing protein n=1 Tax=Phytohabitans maris TaxID=3071409 RepID=A0ABU0ZIB2_9ACTN|nr:hypothetical protein [Phytohabitans sp. ZYX-F-186]MDQ7906799.1 hypothetical protein [Phytohabitans sp. ZYX-F-186]